MFQKIHKPQSDVITIYIDDVPVEAEVGETVATVLLRQPSVSSRTTIISGDQRGPYCMMGVCFDCLAIVDGVFSTQTCLTQVSEGMKVERQKGCQDISL